MTSILLSYTTEKFQALNSHGLTFVLTIEQTSWWGLKKRIVKSRYTVPLRIMAHTYTAIWDDLIKTKKQIK